MREILANDGDIELTRIQAFDCCKRQSVNRSWVIDKAAKHIFDELGIDLI